jgi:regulatory protein
MVAREQRWTERPPPGDEGPCPPDEQGLGPDADVESVARKILLDQLTGQARSRAELAAKLARKQVPAEVADRMLDRFEEVGLVDDAAFARDWVQSRHASRGLARRALSVELQRKGVDAEVVAEAVADLDADDETEAARELVRRKLRSVQRFDTATRVRRLTGMLARKGYPPGIAFRVVKEEVAEADRDLGEHLVEDI